MSTSVIVLHNGLRERVVFDKCKPLSVVLESVCTKFGLSASRYTLVSGSKGVNMSTPFELSSVPSNALLELHALDEAAAAAAAATTVRIQMQFATGGRAEGAFSPSATLGDVLLSLLLTASDAAGGVDADALASSHFAGVSLVYIRQSVKGGALEVTPLSSLGILRGTATLRASLPTPTAAALAAADTPTHVQPSTPTAAPAAAPTAAAATEDGGMQVDARAPSPRQPAVTSVAHPHAAAGEVVSHGVADVDMSLAGETPPPSVMVRAPAALPLASPPAAAPPAAAQPLAADAPLTARVRAALAGLRGSNFVADTAAALSTLITVLDNLLRSPEDARFRALRLSNPKVHAAIGRHPQAVDILHLAGFESSVQEGANVLTLPLAREVDENTLLVRQLVASEAASLDAAVPPPPQVDFAARRAAAAAVVEVPFNPYASSVLRMDSALEAILPTHAGSAATSASIPETAAGAAAGAAAPEVVAGADDARPSVDELSGGTATDRRLAERRAAIERLQMAVKPADRQTLITTADVRAVVAAESAAAAAATSSPVGGGAAGGAEAEAETPIADPDASRLLAAYAKKKMADASTEKTFKTAAQRELEALENASIVLTRVMRIEMPDRCLIEGVFSPLERCADVHAWIDSLLSPAAAAMPHYLYFTPPATLFARADTPLAESKAAGGTGSGRLLRFGWGTGVGARAPPSPAATAPSSPAEYLNADTLRYMNDGSAPPLSGSTTTLAAAVAAANGETTGGGARAAAPAARAPISDAELDRMTARLLAGEAPLPRTASSGAAGRGTTAGGGGKKPAWLKI